MKMIGIGRRLIHRRVSPVKLLPFSGETLSSSSDSETASLLNSKTLLKPFLSLASSSAKWVLHPSHRFLSTSSADGAGEEESDGPLLYEISSDGESDGWEEEEEAEAKVGDGGSGGGIVLQGVPWGERALAIAREVLDQFGVDDIELFSFKTTPRGYIYLRLDKMSTQYGCPSIDELEEYNQRYNKRLEEVGALGEIPDNLAVEVSSPGADRLLKVPVDIERFKDMAMNVCYVEADTESNHQEEKNGVFFLESVDTETENCVWKLADVKENRDPLSKGRPLNRKRRDWRLTLPFRLHTNVTLYIEF
ncbi:hypothetical protein LINPERPRIM_LOCUS22877 [Linum perenne]